VTSNLPFEDWSSVFGTERLTGALLDRLTHHVHILEMNGDSYRLKQSKRYQRAARAASTPDSPPAK
jgi:DNA replication protein DnaC